jgi:hypothetical protein
MKKMFVSNKHVNYGIALALFGILVFSLATSVEGFGVKETPAADENPAVKKAKKPSAKDAIKEAQQKAQQMLMNLPKSKPSTN